MSIYYTTKDVKQTIDGGKNKRKMAIVLCSEKVEKNFFLVTEKGKRRK